VWYANEYVLGLCDSDLPKIACLLLPCRTCTCTFDGPDMSIRIDETVDRNDSVPSSPRSVVTI
jgi:hypothetical protein